MMNILADSTLPHLDALFCQTFALTTYHNEETLLSQIASHDILLCRSTLHVSAKLLENTSIQCVATASSGIDHIDVDYLTHHNITLLDAKGCNAHAVADYVTSTVAWLLTHHKIKGFKAGIIGFGEVGSRVSERLIRLNFSTVHYDPLKAMTDKSFKTATLEDIKDCDLICIHANLHASPPFPSVHLFNAAFLSQLKPKTVIINAARGGIVNEQDLLQPHLNLIYCTDVYEDEPVINPSIVDVATLCTPHIAGHSIEAKENAVISLATAIHQKYQIAFAKQIQPLEPICIERHQHESTEDYFLRLYNPFLESEALKKAYNKQEAFLRLRKAHLFRHDFNTSFIRPDKD